MPPNGSVSLSPIALCRVDDVLALIDPSLTEDLNLIAGLINTFSERVEGDDLLNRSLQKKTYSEIFDGGVHQIVVAAPPIDKTADLVVWEDPGSLFTDTSWQLVKNQSYKVRYDLGQLRRIYGLSPHRYTFMCGPETVRIDYTGGLVVCNEQTGEFSAPAALKDACAMQVSNWFLRRKELGINSIQMLNGQTNYASPTAFLPGVLTLLAPYRRFDC